MYIHVPRASYCPPLTPPLPTLHSKGYDNDSICTHRVANTSTIFFHIFKSLAVWALLVSVVRTAPATANKGNPNTFDYIFKLNNGPVYCVPPDNRYTGAR